jgi:hypothetical protein
MRRARWPCPSRELHACLKCIGEIGGAEGIKTRRICQYFSMTWLKIDCLPTNLPPKNGWIAGVGREWRRIDQLAGFPPRRGAPTTVTRTTSPMQHLGLRSDFRVGSHGHCETPGILWCLIRSTSFVMMGSGVRIPLAAPDQFLEKPMLLDLMAMRCRG